jgi:hypothetical protein
VDQQISLTQCISHTLEKYTLCVLLTLSEKYYTCIFLALSLLSSFSQAFLFLLSNFWCISSSLRRCPFIGQASCFMDNKVHQVVSQQPPSSSSSFVNKWHHIFDLFGQRPIASKKRVGFPFFSPSRSSLVNKCEPPSRSSLVNKCEPQ